MASIVLASRLFAVLRTIVFALVFMGTTGIYLPWYLGLLHRRLAVDARLLGTVPLLIGAYIALHCAFSFAWRGRGTPAPFDPPIRLVIEGMYRYVRNPMYIGMAILMVGEWLLWGTSLRMALVYFAGYWVCVILFVVGYEEPVLTSKFGDGYQEFRANVPRFIPRVTPWCPQKKNAARSST